ncbi:MAG TPA: hypothetical protein VF260_08060 [Bacilli bacterium]
MQFVEFSPSLQFHVRNLKSDRKTPIVNLFNAADLSKEESKAMLKVFSQNEPEKPVQVKAWWS